MLLRATTALAVLALCAACAPLRSFVAGVYSIETAFAPSDPRRSEGVEVEPGVFIEAACTAGSINWIVPVRGGVVLVDAGFDERGARITDALRGRRVLAVLLTHAHLDHRAAAHQFAAPVYVGRRDVALLDNDYAYRDFFLHLAAAVGVPPRPRTVIPVDDGHTLVIGGRTFTAVALPGHTPGSTAWHTGALLFTGDAAQSPLGDAIYPAPDVVSDDLPQAYRSLARLRAVPFTTMLDAHFGKLDDAKRHLAAAIALGADDVAMREAYPAMRPAGCREP